MKNFDNSCFAQSLLLQIVDILSDFLNRIEWTHCEFFLSNLFAGY